MLCSLVLIIPYPFTNSLLNQSYFQLHLLSSIGGKWKYSSWVRQRYEDPNSKRFVSQIALKVKSKKQWEWFYRLKLVVLMVFIFQLSLESKASMCSDILAKLKIMKHNEYSPIVSLVNNSFMDSFIFISYIYISK